MNSILKNSLPENIEALMQEIHAEVSKDNLESEETHQKLLKNYLKRSKSLRQEKIYKMNERIHSHTTEDKLKNKISELSVKKELEAVKKWVQSLFSSLKNTSDQGERYNQRILRILDDIDDGKTTVINDKSEQGNHIASKNIGGEAIGDALESQIELKHTLQMTQEVQRRVQTNKVENDIDRQKGAIRGQLEAIKKAKIFGKIFQVFQIMTNAVMTTLTTGAGSPLLASLIQSVYGTVMQSLSSLGMKPIQDKMLSNQIEEKNANRDVNELVRAIARDEKDYQKSQTKTNEQIDILEMAQYEERK